MNMENSEKCAEAMFTRRLLIAAALCMCSRFALAGQLAGTVIKLSGPLTVKKLDGSVKVLAVGAEIEKGDTLITGKNTYAMILFIDKSEITLRPDTIVKIKVSAEK